VHDDNDVRKALFTLSESAAYRVDADRCRASLAAKARLDEGACQVIEKCMPGMIRRKLTVALNAHDLTVQTLLITGAHDSVIPR